MLVIVLSDPDKLGYEIGEGQAILLEPGNDVQEFEYSARSIIIAGANGVIERLKAECTAVEWGRRTRKRSLLLPRGSQKLGEGL